MTEWSSESDDYIGEEFKQVSKPKKPMEAKVADKDKELAEEAKAADKDSGPAEEAKVADQDIEQGEKSALNPLNQVFDNTYHQKIK